MPDASKTTSHNILIYIQKIVQNPDSEVIDQPHSQPHFEQTELPVSGCRGCRGRIKGAAPVCCSRCHGPRQNTKRMDLQEAAHRVPPKRRLSPTNAGGGNGGPLVSLEAVRPTWFVSLGMALTLMRCSILDD